MGNLLDLGDISHDMTKNVENFTKVKFIIMQGKWTTCMYTIHCQISKIPFL